MVVDEHVPPHGHVAERDAVEQLNPGLILLGEEPRHMGGECHVEALPPDLGELEHLAFGRAERGVQLGGRERRTGAAQLAPAGQHDLHARHATQPLVQRPEADEVDRRVPGKQDAHGCGFLRGAAARRHARSGSRIR